MDKKISVLHMTKLGAGGISTLTVNINSLIDRNKIIFDYLVFENVHTFYEDKVQKLGAKKRVVDVCKYQNRKMLLYWKKYALTKKMLKKYPYDIMHVDASTPMDVVIGLAAKHAGVKRIILHSHIAGDNKHSIFRSCYMAACRCLMNMVFTDYLAISDSSAKFMFPTNIWKNHKYHIVKNGIIADKYVFDVIIRNRIRDELGILDKNVVGHIGRFSEEKNHIFLLNVFKRYLQYKPNSVLLIIGDGKLRHEIEQKIKDMELENSVILYGTATNVNEMLMAMDIFVFPSKYEGLGLVAIEAQCSGLPTFCSEGIPNEANITELFYQIEGYEVDNWAKVLAEYKCVERTSNIEAVKNSGFDLKDVSNDLQKFYLTGSF